jgi:hypothetical protein
MRSVSEILAGRVALLELTPTSALSRQRAEAPDEERKDLLEGLRLAALPGRAAPVAGANPDFSPVVWKKAYLVA